VGLRGPKARDRSGDTPESRAAYGRARLAEERAAAALRGGHSAKIAKLPKAPDPFESISKAINKSMQRTMNEVVAEKAPKGATLRASGYDSSCFESLQWKAYKGAKGAKGTQGAVTATFWRGGNLVYVYDDIDLDSFVDWCSSSYGGYFNAEIR
jgi:hypothetical protein